ncbi:hypothetical protein FRB99_005553 [Tulasnella sp. 403]|nr:hypothetical protein FRB99_005553 [Tulasnella sp. 403]
MVHWHAGRAYFLKSRVGKCLGRLRPDFLARCAWSEALTACTGKDSVVLNGRMSFPSGHSSTAFSGLGFLFLFLAGKTGACCLTAAQSRAGLTSSRLLKLSITIAPLVLASWIAITRLEDYRHHKEDIIVGSLIGFLSSLAAYTIYWESPFNSKVYEQGVSGQARFVYDPETTSSYTAENFELGTYEEIDLEAGLDSEDQPPRGRGREAHTRGRGRRGNHV